MSTFTYGSDGLRRRGVVAEQTQIGESNSIPPHPIYSTTGSTQTDYVYDGSMLVEEIVQHFNGGGSAIDTPTTISYLQGPQGPLYRKSSAAADPSWYVYDGLGSVVGEVDVNGNMTAGKLFDVYGATRSLTGTPTTRQGFVGGLGHETDDETGLVYMQHRYYDPGTGRFISEDPTKSGEDFFIYSSNDPVNRVDCDGLTDTFVAQEWINVFAQFAQLCKFVGMTGGGGSYGIIYTSAAIANAQKGNYALALINTTAASLCFGIALIGVNADVPAFLSIALSAGQGGYLAILQSDAENAELGTKGPGYAIAAITACVAESAALTGACISADYSFLNG